MRARGINYDTGTFPAGQLTRKAFDPATVKRGNDCVPGPGRGWRDGKTPRPLASGWGKESDPD